jgi:hypothetical protein
MIRLKYFSTLLICILSVFSSRVYSTGISVDAGLNPAEDRWIIRMQYRQMSMDAAMHQMNTDMLMAVLAYGFTQDVTLMIRQMATRSVMSMSGTDKVTSGLTDLAVLGKFGMYRKNTRNLTLALASTLALKMPTGSENITSDTWDLQAGLYGSWRSGRWGNDLNLTYSWNGFTGPAPSGLEPGDVIGLDAAFSYQFSIGSSADISLTPVLEFNYRYSMANQYDGREADGARSIFFVSPGLKFTHNSFITEILVQFPVKETYQNLDQNRRGLIGFRYMF